MQRIIIQEILKHSLISIEIGEKLVLCLFENDYTIPKEVEEKRPSLLNFLNVVKWGGSVENGYIAALSSLNSAHGCFGDAYDLIKHYLEDTSVHKIKTYHLIGDLVNKKKKIPGFGSPVFKKGLIDARCENIEKEVFAHFPNFKKEISYLLRIVKTNTNKELRTNLVFWNAFVAYILGLPREYASLVFILASFIRYTNLLTQQKK